MSGLFIGANTTVYNKRVSVNWGATVPFKPGLHVRRKHKHMDVYTCDKHKHKVTCASAKA